MYPEFELGHWHLSTYNALYTLAILAAGLYACRRVLQGIDLDPAVNIWGPSLLIAGGLVGAGAIRLTPTALAFWRTGTWEWVGGSSL